VLVGRYDSRHNLGVVKECFREKRADGTVYQATDKRFRIGRTRLPLEETARYFATGICLFRVVNGQREKVLTLFGFFLSYGGYQHHRIPASYHYGTIGLFGHFAGG